MQSFRPNISMNNFHTVEGAATIYDLVFGLWEQANACLDLNVHTLRYEDLVSDLEPTVAQLLAFSRHRGMRVSSTTPKTHAAADASAHRATIRSPNWSTPGRAGAGSATATTWQNR